MPEVKALAGVIVTVNREGDVEIIRGLVREADRRTLDASQRNAEKARRSAPKGNAGDEARGSAADVINDDDACDRHVEPVASKRAEFSDALSRRLAAHRTLALQVMLSRNPPVALAALAHVLAQRVLGDEYRRTGPALQITAQAASHALTQAADDLKEAPAWLALQTVRDAWVERLPTDRSAWFECLLELPQADLLDLVALCAALTVNALPSAGSAVEASALAVAVGLNMADWWQPTAECFLNHVSKAQIVGALHEAGSGLATDSLAEMKKDVLVETALARLKGTRWLPAPLRSSSA